MSNYPEPIIRDSNYSITITPYYNLNWIDTAAKFNIKIPENIIDKTQGKSKCDICGAVYSGTQDNCTKIIEWHKKFDRYYKERGWFYAAERNYMEPCGGHLRWDLSGSFVVQQQFFSVLDKIASYYYNDEFEQFKDSFPPEVVDHFRIIILKNELQRNIMDIQNALNQIASKMNMAGQHLQF